MNLDRARVERRRAELERTYGVRVADAGGEQLLRASVAAHMRKFWLLPEKEADEKARKRIAYLREAAAFYAWMLEAESLGLLTKGGEA